MSAASILFCIAAWLWLCLVMSDSNHMRTAIVGAVTFPILFALLTIEIAVNFVKEMVLLVNQLIGQIGHDEGGDV